MGYSKKKKKKCNLNKKLIAKSTIRKTGDIHFHCSITKLRSIKPPCQLCRMYSLSYQLVCNMISLSENVRNMISDGFQIIDCLTQAS